MAAGIHDSRGRVVASGSSFSLAQILLLALLGGIAPLGTDIYLASIPDVAGDLNTRASVVQFTLTGFMAGLAIGPLFIGPISDRYGRYALLVAGVVALLISSVLCAVVPSVEALIAARVIQGFSGSIAMTLCRTLVADVVSGAAAARIYSLLSTVMGVSPIIAPVIGGAIQQWGHWRLAFWVLAAISAILAAGVLGLLHETLPPERRQSGGLRTALQNAGRVLKDGHFMSYAAALGFTSGALFAYIAASPFVVQQVLGYSPLVYSLLFALNAAGLTATAGISAGAVEKIGAARLVRLGALTILSGAALLAVAAMTNTLEPWLLLPAMFLIPTGTGFMLGNGTALAVQTVGYAAGTALAFVGFLQFGMSGLVAPLVSIAGPRSIVPLAVISLCSAALTVGSAAIGARFAARTLSHET
ncbi:MAG: multidrug effflux MFS transporter [Leucobacter sp.]